MTIIDGGKHVLVACVQYDYDQSMCTYITTNTWDGASNRGCYKINNRDCINGIIKLDWVQWILQGRNWERDWTSEEET
jgi:hypothetical protein